MTVTPYSVPGYNKFRVPTVDQITIDKTVLAIESPDNLTTFIRGMVSLLSEPNVWEQVGMLPPDDMVDAFNNEVVFMALCDAIADCINNSVAVQDALAAWMADTTTGAPGEPNNAPASPINAPAYNPSCDKDILWAQCLQLVEHVNSLVVDALQQFEVADQRQLFHLAVDGIDESHHRQHEHQDVAERQNDEPSDDRQYGTEYVDDDGRD